MEFSLKPVFVGWAALVAQLPVQLFLTFWCALFFGGITAGITAEFEGDFTAQQFFTAPAFLIFGALAFFGVPLIVYIVKKLNYARVEYRFYGDHVELEEGFFSVNRKEVRYADVREITLRKGFLQRFNGLGSIYMATLATGIGPHTGSLRLYGFGTIASSGAFIRDVRDPDLVYDKIRRLVKPK